MTTPENVIPLRRPRTDDDAREQARRDQLEQRIAAARAERQRTAALTAPQVCRDCAMAGHPCDYHTATDLERTIMFAPPLVDRAEIIAEKRRRAQREHDNRWKTRAVVAWLIAANIGFALIYAAGAR